MTSQQDLHEIHNVMEQAMTAKQVREMLENVDDDSRVFFVCNYGDHHNTPQALPVCEVIGDCSVGNLATTAYSQSGVQMIEEEGEVPDDEYLPVAFLR